MLCELVAQSDFRNRADNGASLEPAQNPSRRKRLFKQITVLFEELDVFFFPPTDLLTYDARRNPPASDGIG